MQCVLCLCSIYCDFIVTVFIIHTHIIPVGAYVTTIMKYNIVWVYITISFGIDPQMYIIPTVGRCIGGVNTLKRKREKNLSYLNKNKIDYPDKQGSISNFYLDTYFLLSLRNTGYLKRVLNEQAKATATTA